MTEWWGDGCEDGVVLVGWVVCDWNRIGLVPCGRLSRVIRVSLATCGWNKS